MLHRLSVRATSHLTISMRGQRATGKIQRNNYYYRSCGPSLKATFHLTISVRGKRATDKIQRNNYHHGSCGPSLTGKTMSVFLFFTQGTHRNAKNR